MISLTNGSDNELAPNRQQTIPWTNADPDLGRHVVSARGAIAYVTVSLSTCIANFQTAHVFALSICVMITALTGLSNIQTTQFLQD